MASAFSFSFSRRHDSTRIAIARLASRDAHLAACQRLDSADSLQRLRQSRARAAAKPRIHYSSSRFCASTSLRVCGAKANARERLRAIEQRATQKAERTRSHQERCAYEIFAATARPARVRCSVHAGAALRAGERQATRRRLGAAPTPIENENRSLARRLPTIITARPVGIGARWQCGRDRGSSRQFEHVLPCVWRYVPLFRSGTYLHEPSRPEAERRRVQVAKELSAKAFSAHRTDMREE